MMRFEIVAILLVVSSLTLKAQNDCVVVEKKTYCYFHKNKLQQVDTVVVQINNRNGDKWAEIGLPYTASNTFQNFDARITDTNGSLIRKIANNECTDKQNESYSTFYSDHYTRCFTAKHNVYPYRIQYSYKQVFTAFVNLVWWTPVVSDQLTTQTGKLVFTTDTTVGITLFDKNIPAKAVTQQGSENTYTWNTSFEKTNNTEYFAPGLGTLYPTVIIDPANFVYGVPGQLHSWVDYGNWLYALADDAHDVPADEKLKVLDMVKGIADDREKVKRIYHYVLDNTRYINVSLKTGGLKPYPASYVIKNKYGDCKALTNYLYSLLQVVDIKPYVVHVDAEDQSDSIFAAIPCPQFNHVVLMVPLAHDTLWLESTNSSYPFNYLGYTSQNKDAFLIEKDNSRLVRTPSFQLSDVTNATTYSIQIDDNNNADIQVSFVCKGAFFDAVLGLDKELSKTNQDRYIHNLVPYKVYELKSWNIGQRQRDDQQICLNLHLEIESFVSNVGDYQLIGLPPLFLSKFEPAKDRRYPVYFPSPICQTDSLAIKLPKRFVHTQVPANLEYTSEYGQYRLVFWAKDDTVFVKRTFLLNKGYVTIGKYPNFLTFIQQIQKANKTAIQLQ